MYVCLCVCLYVSACVCLRVCVCVGVGLGDPAWPAQPSCPLWTREPLEPRAALLPIQAGGSSGPTRQCLEKHGVSSLITMAVGCY